MVPVGIREQLVVVRREPAKRVPGEALRQPLREAPDADPDAPGLHPREIVGEQSEGRRVEPADAGEVEIESRDVAGVGDHLPQAAQGRHVEPVI